MKIDFSKLPKWNILTVDFKSYYSSVECVLRGLDPLTTYLAVVGDLSRSGSICLAASPLMKKEYKIKTGSRLYEIPRDPKIHVVEARMNTYLDFAMAVPKILNRFVPMECITIYSIDEAIIVCDHDLYGDKWETARAIQMMIQVELGLPTAVGIGSNYFQSKCCLDILAKHNAANGYIDEVTYENFAEKIWHFPVRDSWGIGHRMEKNLARLGVHTIGDLAKAHLPLMKKRFGIIGEQMVMHANGIDLTDPYYRPNMNNHAISQKGFGSGITLLRDFYGADIITAILDRAEEVAQRARDAKMAGRTINISVGYSSDLGGGGFSKAHTIAVPTNLTHKIFQVCKQLFQENDTKRPVRNIHVGLTNLVKDEVSQLDLFEDDTKERQIASTMDAIRKKFGTSSITWARSMSDGGTFKERTSQVGGHKA